MKCQIVCPIEGKLHDYNGKCFVTFDSINCFDDKFKDIGRDSESAKKLFNALAANDALNQENAERSEPARLKIKNLSDKVLLKYMLRYTVFVLFLLALMGVRTYSWTPKGAKIYVYKGTKRTCIKRI